MKTVLKRVLQIVLSLQFAICFEPVAALGDAPSFETVVISSSDDNDIKDNVLFCDSLNVACLAQTEYDLVSIDDETMAVTVPATEWSLAAVNTSRSYVAFSHSGTKLDTASGRLGVIELNSSSDVVILKSVTGVVSPDGQSVCFSGHELGVEDYQLAFSASGLVGGQIDSSEERAAFQAIEPVLPEGAEAALVDMPELNSRTAQIWSSCYHGDTLTMYEYGVESDGEYPAASFMMNVDNYMGYYPGVSPLGGEGGDFLDARFLDSWVVDAEGYLWHVDSAGKQYFYGTPFFCRGRECNKCRRSDADTGY